MTCTHLTRRKQHNSSPLVDNDDRICQRRPFFGARAPALVARAAPSVLRRVQTTQLRQPSRGIARTRLYLSTNQGLAYVRYSRGRSSLVLFAKPRCFEPPVGTKARRPAPHPAHTNGTKPSSRRASQERTPCPHLKRRKGPTARRHSKRAAAVRRRRRYDPRPSATSELPHWASP